MRAFSGEEVNEDGSVRWQGTSQNVNNMTWTMRAGRNRVVVHEYMEARYWQLEGVSEVLKEDQVRREERKRIGRGR